MTEKQRGTMKANGAWLVLTAVVTDEAALRTSSFVMKGGQVVCNDQPVAVSAA
ncbi:MAG TPA: hypothetical protein VNR40_15660 [Steroidobacter sp.]|nr:hypothetical protein [Steroidobacter sp.]